LFSSSSLSLSFSSTTLPSLQNTMLTHLSLSVHVMIISLQQVHHTLSTSIHRVQPYPEYNHTSSTRHTPSTAYSKYSIYPRLVVFLSFS
jgi:hypothetical protein